MCQENKRRSIRMLVSCTSLIIMWLRLRSLQGGVHKAGIQSWHTVHSVYFQWHFSACFYCCIFPEYLCRRRGAHVIFWIRFLRFSFRKYKISALKTKGKMLHPKCNRFLIQLRAGTSVTARSISVYSWRKLPSSGAMESWQAPEKTPLLIYLLPVLFYSSSTFMHSSLHTLTVREACTGLRWNLRPLEPLVWHLSSSRQEETPYQVCLKAAMNIQGSGLMTCSQGGGGTWTAWSEMTEWRINRVICLDYSSQGQLTDPSVASTLRLTRTSNTHATQLFIQMRNEDNWCWTYEGFIWLQPGNSGRGLRRILKTR